ncbi:MAG: SAM-dependent methyltransferase [Gammaproteobacteria bacterium]|nr:SAM-dependent methyltransferase [Gammaproteobacteria bacterium]
MSSLFEEPTTEALAHSARLASRIREEIAAAGGWIPFSRYMELALYEPALGYYSAGATKFGPAGDFVTAPEISPVFARCLARASAPLLAALPEPVVLEFGAGTGALAYGLLGRLASLDALPQKYLILEVSAELRTRQREYLANLGDDIARRVEWIDRLPAAKFDGLVIANEVADALPVERFVRRAPGPRALGVCIKRGTFQLAEADASAGLAAAVAAIEQATGGQLPDGYTSEVSLRLPGWINAVAGSLRRGTVFIGDYGCTRSEYYLPERRDGTFLCYYRHRAHRDALLYPGLQDMTAWVDFTLLAASAVGAGLDVAGYATQAHFLIDAGVDIELEEFAGRQDAASLRALQQAKTLLLPGEMGERCKIMALARGVARSPGFGFRDLRSRL